ncbi:MAG: type II toxin-antitoxin system VapC family toxin [Actinomycetota bacterium]|nr:type II toxin-antitoxin system VapC family toxin [Actinomycetota bacterium]
MTRRSSVVVDASTVFATLLPEVSSAEAHAVLAGVTEVWAPDLLPYEIVSALAARVRRGDISPEEADLKRLEARSLPASLVPASDLDAQALTLALRLGHSAYDCFYLALALECECPLVTCDQKLAAAAGEAGLGAYVRLLG